MKVNEINKEIKKLKSAGKISDGYHTFDELYEHRVQLFISLANVLTRHNEDIKIVDEYANPEAYYAWKSKLHHDGSNFDGWFIAGIGLSTNKQISYHLPLDKWDELLVVELDKAPLWDGHTSSDVVQRLIKKYSANIYTPKETYDN